MNPPPRPRTPLSPSVVRFTSALASCVALLASTTSARADRLWDSDLSAIGNSTAGANLGGSGVWNTALGNWWNGASAINGPWPNGFSETAIFSGAAGTVNINTGGTGVLASGLRFNVGNYVIAGNSTSELLTLGGASPTVTVAKADTTTTLSATIAGSSGLTVAGSGTLALTGANTYSGGTTLNSGTLRVWHDSNLGAAGAPVTLNGGKLQLASMYLDRAVNVTAASTIDASALTGSANVRALSGSGSLTKTGTTELRMTASNDAYTGALTVARSSVRLINRDQGFDALHALDGSLRHASAYAIETGGSLVANFASDATAAPDAMADNAPIAMRGGVLQFISTSRPTGQREVAGQVALGRSLSSINVTQTNANQAAVFEFGGVSRQTGTTVNFSNTGGTLGATGANPRITFRAVPALNDGIVGGWAVVNAPLLGSGNIDFAGYVGSGGVGDQGVGALGTAGFANYVTHTAATIGAAAATDNALINASSGFSATVGNVTLNSLKFNNPGAGTATLGQLVGTTLTIDSGGIICSGSGTQYILGTAGANLTTNSDALYFHVVGNVTVNSTINGAGVALVRDLAGTFALSADNSYGGGTYLTGPGTTSTGSTAGRKYLGTGPVFVSATQLNLGQPGATSSPAGFTATDGARIQLQQTAAPYNTNGDRFTIEAGSMIYGSSTSPGNGLNSLTRVATLTGPGQVVLAPGAIVGYSGPLTGPLDLVNQTIRNLGTAADLFFGIAGTNSAASAITLGVGTPFKGMSSGPFNAWRLGTIFVSVGTTDIVFNSQTRNQSGTVSVVSTPLVFGDGTATAGGMRIDPLASGPVNAHITGFSVTLGDSNSIFGRPDAPVTFVVEGGSELTVSQPNALGSGSGIASVRVGQGGSFGPNATANFGDEINGEVRIEAGGRFHAQRANGLSGTGTIAFEPGSILHLSNPTGWSGPQADATNIPDTTVVRLAVNAFGTATQPLFSQPSFSGAGIYELSAGTVAAANPTAPDTTILSLNHGGIVTNDTADRTWLPAANGVITVGAGGGVLAASTGTFLRMQNAASLGANTLTVGSDRSIDGNLKHGEVRLAATVDATPGAQIAVLADVALRLDAADVLDDDLRITLGAGSLLIVDNADTVDRVSGASSSTISGDSRLTLANASGTDFTLDSRLNGSAGFELVKQGAGTLTLTNPASTGTGQITVAGGRLTVNGSLAQIASASVNGAGAELKVNGSINPAAQTLVVNGTVSGTGSLGPVATSGATTAARLAPGNSIGILTVQGTAATPGLDLSGGTGAVLSIELGKVVAGAAVLGAGVDYDQVVVSGDAATLNTIVLGFNAALEITVPSGRFVDDGDLFFIAVNIANDAAVSGTFATLPEGATVVADDGTEFKITYAADWAGAQAGSASSGGNDIALIAVPEPTVAVSLVGTLPLFLIRRRRRR